jgi:hypothetical protein
MGWLECCRLQHLDRANLPSHQQAHSWRIDVPKLLPQEAIGRVQFFCWRVELLLDYAALVVH